MIAIAEMETGAVLFHLDAVKNTAAHIARAFERIEPVAHYQHQRFAFLEARHALTIQRIAQQCLAERRIADVGGIKIDISGGGIIRFADACRPGFACRRKGVIDLADGEMQMGNFALREQGLPVGRDLRVFLQTE